MWRSGWVLVPSEDVQRILDETSDADIELWDYPWVGFPDGEVEGRDLNNLWSLVCDSPSAGNLWGAFLREAADGCEKVAAVRPAAIDAFAALSEARIHELATAWQTSSLAAWKLEEVVEKVWELKCLARQQLKFRPRWELLMIWYR